MPDPQHLAALADAGAAANERFVQESKAIDVAFYQGRLQNHVRERLADELRRAGFSEPPADEIPAGD